MTHRILWLIKVSLTHLRKLEITGFTEDDMPVI